MSVNNKLYNLKLSKMDKQAAFQLAKQAIAASSSFSGKENDIFPSDRFDLLGLNSIELSILIDGIEKKLGYPYSR